MSNNNLVGYVHRLSPVKKGKSAEYSDFEIQLKDERINGVCFSQVKRKLLQEAAVNMKPLKISHFVAGSFCGKPSVKINNMTRISEATTVECHYQYQPSAASQKISLKTVLDSVEPNQIVGQVEGKITKDGDQVHIKGASNLRMMNSVINDSTQMVNLSLWEQDIDQVVSGRVYRVSNVRVRLFNGTKLLTSTRNSTFEEINDETEAKKLLDDLNDLKSMVVQSIQQIENIDRFLKCLHCNKKLQTSITGKIIACDSCHHRMRVADCPKSISVRLTMLREDHTAISLTVFLENLEKVIQHPLEKDDDQLSEDILDLADLSVKYNAKNIIQELTE